MFSQIFVLLAVCLVSALGQNIRIFGKDIAGYPSITVTGEVASQEKLFTLVASTPTGDQILVQTNKTIAVDKLEIGFTPMKVLLNAAGSGNPAELEIVLNTDCSASTATCYAVNSSGMKQAVNLAIGVAFWMTASLL